MVATTYFISYIIVLNLFSLFLMYRDKKKAQKNKWRIRESTLFLFALLGGSVGVFLGMKWFRHKTKHFSFRLFIPIIIFIQIVFVLLLS